MVHTLTQPDRFTRAAPDGTICRGADQEWFPRPWQRRAGCGPTAAAVVLDYLSAVRPELAALGPHGDFVSYMEALWTYLTPGPMGLDKAESFALGCRSFALSRGAALDCPILPIPRRGKGARPGREETETFLARALDNDCPAAFLNYSRGDLPNLDSWHWVPLIACAGGDGTLTASALDGGEEKTLDLALWLETSRLGGAFVLVLPHPEA